MRRDFIIKNHKGFITITTKRKEGIALTKFFNKIDEWILTQFGKDYKVEKFYLTPKDASSFDFLTNVPYNLYLDIE